MTIKSKLGDVLASIYLCAAIVILFRWATNISPVIEGGWFNDSHNLLEVLIITLPFIPSLLLSPFLGHYQDANITLDSLVFVKPFETVLMIGIVVLNAICWYFIGFFIEYIFYKIKNFFQDKNSNCKRKK